EVGDVYESRLIRPRQAPGGTLKNRRIELNTDPAANSSVRMRDEFDASVMDQQDGFMMESPAVTNPHDGSIESITDVAIINQPRRFTLSEPAEGYPVNYPDDLNPFLQWYGPTHPDVLQAVLDQHPEGFYGASPNTPKPIDTPLDKATGPWTRDDGLTINGPETKVDFRAIYLQRLANPLLPWNPEPNHPSHVASKAVNPYRTVDVSTSNLTVFNGRENMSGNQNAGNRLYSIERGWRNDTGDAQQDTAASDNVWSVENQFDPTGQIPAQRPDPVQKLIDNTSFSAFTILNIPDSTIGFLNRPFMDPAKAGTPEQHQLIPEKPFPWLTWNNRPYISANELMQVPTTRSSQLLKTFSLRAKDEVYKGAITGNSGTVKTDGVFRHQANFFRYDEDGAKKAVAGLYRVLEYLHVPSRFVGTEMWLNPASFGQEVTDVTDPRFGRQPPFNRISAYREPGKMNLNTISSNTAWLSLQGALDTNNDGSIDVQHRGPSWQRLRASRRGYGGDDDALLNLNNNAPTFFENPFRLSDAANMVPLPSMTRENVDCTLLRSNVIGGVTANNNAEPLFVSSNTAAHSNANRNSYFRYQPLTRLDNLTTTRSNVYAVWITVGFFEVQPAPKWSEGDGTYDNGVKVGDIFPDLATYQKAYPEGYMLGKEAGIDTGDVVRLREFAIIDRSIPVAFEPGADHNVEQTIRLRRRIE
ncbi:MAG: hypothetical protein MI725_02745, partial [Pirellulales bacterium]|nr:hypothetical protein [Pirellulales bacterium]